MLAVLPLLVFLALFSLIAISPGRFLQIDAVSSRQEESDVQACLDPDWREAFLKAAIAWGALVVLLSEGLSLFRALHQTALAVGWGFLLLGCLSIGRRKGVFHPRFWRPTGQFLIQSLRSQDGLLLLIPVLFFAVLALVAWMAPPNTNDSLAYHMSRVMHWIQDRGLQHYATPIPRQIWMPEWAELAMLQFQSLNGSDRLDNFVQWFSAIASVIGVSLIAKRLGVGFPGQVLAAVFCATIPMGILQASSTQNDYVNAFWVVCLVYFAVLAHQRRLSATEWIWVSLAVGLGVLTKGTFYAFALPFLAWLGVSVIRREGFIPAGRWAFLGLVVVILLNGGMWARNIRTYNFPFGPPASITNLSNQKFTPAAIISNVLRNAALHLGSPVSSINQAVLKSISWVHRQMNQKINDPATTLKENKFKVELSLHEDKAGNPVHFLFFLIILGLLPFVLHKQRETRILGLFYLFAVLSTFLLFSALYKWQIYSTRLQLPFFVLVAPLFGIVLGGPKWANIRLTLAVVFALNGLVYLLMNPSRALLPGNSNNATLFTTPRSKLLFVNSTVFQRGYLRAANAAQATGCRSIGLVIDSSEPEYPFWALLSPSGRDVRLEHLRASPPLDRYAPPGFKPCLVICTTCAGDTWGEYQRLTNLHGAVKLYIPPDIAP